MMSATTARKSACAAGALALTVLTAGCGASNTPPSPAPAPTTSTASATPAAPTTPSPSPSPSSPSPSPSQTQPVPQPSTTTPSGGPTPCLTNHLSISDKPAPGGLEHVATVLVFTNHGPTCTLTGYPGVDGLRGGTAVVHFQRTLRGDLGGATSTKTVTVPAGGSASALFEGLGAPATGQSCTRYTSLLVTPPNNRQSVPLTSKAPICSPQIHPVVPGAAGGATNS